MKTLIRVDGLLNQKAEAIPKCNLPIPIQSSKNAPKFEIARTTILAHLYSHLNLENADQKNQLWRDGFVDIAGVLSWWFSPNPGVPRDDRHLRGGPTFLGLWGV